MKRASLIFSFVAAAGMCGIAAAQDQPVGNIRLPVTDYHFKMTKDYVEETPVPEYRHASAEAYEAFKDMKYGVRIHWGLYSIAGQARRVVAVPDDVVCGEAGVSGTLQDVESRKVSTPRNGCRSSPRTE